ncbi:MAG: type II toxin-antitoxin system Phd/YefM family antitoxin [Anaerolineales bacterium]|nr:type II toxin-antitoxin system Phd/YefM family antitoxin [Anaerolineales bacterium]
MEKKLGVAEAREKFSDVVEQVQYQGDAYLISRHGKPAAAVVPIEVYETWKRQREMFFDAVRQMQEVNQNVDPEEVWADVLLAQQAIRANKE